MYFLASGSRRGVQDPRDDKRAGHPVPRIRSQFRNGGRVSLVQPPSLSPQPPQRLLRPPRRRRIAARGQLLQEGHRLSGPDPLQGLHPAQGPHPLRSRVRLVHRVREFLQALPDLRRDRRPLQALLHRVAGQVAFYAWLGPEKSRRIRLAVMDMWKPFRTSTLKLGHAPQAQIIFDKFHVLRHLHKALDTVRKQEYARLSGAGRQFIKSQKYNLLSRWENLHAKGRAALKLLLRANKRLHTAYLLKESFGQLWDYRTPGWALHFFDEWRDALKWQRLKPYEKFARLVEDHWDGIVSYCHANNKFARGFVEGLNNKIRTIQRRAYGYQDEAYLRLKILTCTLPKR